MADKPMPAEQLAQYLAAIKMLERAIPTTVDTHGNKHPQRLPAGYHLDLTGRELVVKFHDGSTISRDNTDDGTGEIPKAATQHTYGWAMVRAFLHYFSARLAKFRQAERAERVMVELVSRIVNRAIKDGCTSEAAFRELHPVLAKGIEPLKDKIKGRLPKIMYPTPQRTDGGAGITVRAQAKRKRSAA